MREIKLEIFDSSGTYLGDIQLENFKDFPLTLTKGVGDINNLTARQSVYSLDFEIPVTQNNNKLLFGVANVNTSGDTLKSLQRNKCRILVDGNQIEQGFIKVFEHTVNDTYKATFTGGNGDWVDLLANTYLNELEWVAETNSGTVNATETFSSARIDSVNALDSNNIDIVYPYIERNVLSPTQASYLRPQLYLRSVINRMFEKIGYTVDGSFIDSDELNPNDGTHKGVTIDPAFKFINDDDTVQNSRINVTTTQSAHSLTYSIGDDGAGGVTQVSRLNGFYDDETFDVGNNWTPASSVYTASRGGLYRVEYDLSNYRYLWDKDDTGSFRDYGQYQSTGGGLPPSITLYAVKNNTSSTVIDGEVVFTLDLVTGSGNFLDATNFEIGLNNGDELSLWYEINDDSSGWSGTRAHLNAPSLNEWRFQFGFTNPFVKVQISSEIELGETYVVNAQIGEKINCLDLLQDIKVIYNLYFATNFQSKTVTIETRDNYYQNIGNAENITSIVDLSKAISINSEKAYKQQLRFRYKADSNDKYLEKWQKINNRTYGEYTHSFGDDYEKGVDIVETKLIAPTIQKVIDPNGQNIVSSVIRREWEDDKEPTDINQEYNIRIFYVEKSQQFEEDGNARRTTAPLEVTSAMMESFGNVTTYSSKQLTFNGVNGLFSRYYAKTIANIEDVRKVELSLKLPLYKFQSLDLSKPVYIDWSIPQLQGYYIIEEVSNYKLEQFEPVKVKLLRFKNYDAVTVDTSQKTNINENTATGQTGDSPQPIYYVYDEGTIDENYQVVYDVANDGTLIPLYYE